MVFSIKATVHLIPLKLATCHWKNGVLQIDDGRLHKRREQTTDALDVSAVASVLGQYVD